MKRTGLFLSLVVGVPIAGSIALAIYLPTVAPQIVSIAASGSAWLHDPDPPQPPQPTVQEPATTTPVGMRVTPAEVYRDFRKNEKSAQAKYGGKTLCIHGTVSEHGMIPDTDTPAPCMLVQNLIGPGGFVAETGVKLMLCFGNWTAPDWSSGNEFDVTCRIPNDDSNGVLIDHVVLHGCDQHDTYCPREQSPFTDNVTVRDGRVVPKVSNK